MKHLTGRRPLTRPPAKPSLRAPHGGRDLLHHESNHFDTNVKTKGGTSHTPTSAGSFGISAKYQAITARALAAHGGVQSRDSPQRTAGAGFGAAPPGGSRSIAVRCAVWDLPPTASVTNIAW